MNPTIAMLGSGAMGSRMAQRLLDAGHEVVVYNRTPDRASTLVERGAHLAPTPGAAAARADVIIGCVRDDEASRAVWLDGDTGALASLKPGVVALESSTLTPTWVRSLGRKMSEQGVAFLDAPVAGSRPQADAGQLIYLVGGESATLDRVRDLLLVMGGAVHHAGPIGAGAVMKLAVNALFGIQVAALAEVLGMTRRAGIGDLAALEVLARTPVMSPALRGAGALMVARTFDPMFPIQLVEKDLGYFLDTAEELGSAAPTAASVREVYRQAADAGHGGANIVGVAAVFDEEGSPDPKSS